MFYRGQNSDDDENQNVNPKSVTDCELTIEPTTSVSICVEGTDFALPNETITFASTFYSRNDIASNSQFSWTIESGGMKILNIENTFDGLIAKSIATIQFNSDYTGNGVIRVNAENDTGKGSNKHSVELESNK
ncbi:hypothetical protein [Aquimarina sp. I32.4]|uniref:hypothetical protein n=1 Tax=Aquimarina sp. I32.4 TaxID=2053903 RepID=UPI000CDEDA2B|nr:hypothetical protein [Aquimarina sp. I32.4]